MRSLLVFLAFSSTAFAEGPSRADIAKGMKHLSRGIENCYFDAFPKESDSVDEKVTLSFTITPPGVMKDVSVTAEPLLSAAMEECIVKRLTGRPIASHPAGPDVKVKYPFIFKKSGK